MSVGTNPESIATGEVRQKVAKLVAEGLPKPVMSKNVLPKWGIFPRLIGPRPVLYWEDAKLVRQIVKVLRSYNYSSSTDRLALRKLCHQAILRNLMHVVELQTAALSSGAMPDLTVSTTQYRGTDNKYHCWACGNVSEAVQLSLSEHILGMGGGTGLTNRVVVPYCPNCGEKQPEGRGLMMAPLLYWEKIPCCSDSIIGVKIGDHVSLVYRFHGE